MFYGQGNLVGLIGTKLLQTGDGQGGGGGGGVIRWEDQRVKNIEGEIKRNK